MKIKNGGFTILEVLIAMVVFAIGILAVITMQSTSTGSNARAILITRTATTAAEQIETILSLPYDDLDLEATSAKPSSFSIVGYDGSTTHKVSSGDYKIWWWVTQDSPVVGTKTIEVAVLCSSGVTSLTEMTYFKQQVF